ncbi:hypothetical protein D3C75_754910 [compost metagenome]
MAGSRHCLEGADYVPVLQKNVGFGFDPVRHTPADRQVRLMGHQGHIPGQQPRVPGGDINLSVRQHILQTIQGSHMILMGMGQHNSPDGFAQTGCRLQNSVFAEGHAGVNQGQPVLLLHQVTINRKHTRQKRQLGHSLDSSGFHQRPPPISAGL